MIRLFMWRGIASQEVCTGSEVLALMHVCGIVRNWQCLFAEGCDCSEPAASGNRLKVHARFHGDGECICVVDIAIQVSITIGDGTLQGVLARAHRFVMVVVGASNSV
jgi:hypothetical protein